MRNQPLVLLLGESLLMDGVAASLAETHQICLRREVSMGLNISDCIKITKPDMIIF